MALGRSGRGHVKCSGSSRKSPGRTQDGPGRAQGRLMAQGGNEGEGKVKRRRRGKGGWGSNSPSLWPEGEGRMLSKPVPSFAQNMGGGGFEFPPSFGQKGEGGGFNLPPPFWPEGRGRGDARFFGLQGEGEAFRT